jgi:hypothetical protein
MGNVKFQLKPKLEPVTREDQEQQKLERELDTNEVYDLPNAPGTFSLGQEIEPFNESSGQMVTFNLASHKIVSRKR